MKIVLTESQYIKLVESENDETIKCNQCGWKWKKSEGGDDPLVCHQCGHNNDPNSKMGQPRWVRCRNCNKRFTQTVMKNGKKSLPICHHCGTHNQDVDEMTTYSFQDQGKVPKYKKKRDYSDLKKNQENNIFIKKIGRFEFYYSTTDEDGELVISVIDAIEKNMVAKAPFFMKNLDDFEASAPYVDPEYRNMGIGTEIYKTALDFGNIVSGTHQSQYAVGLWKKLYNELPNKMVAVDGKSNYEYPVKIEENKLMIDAEDGMELYGEKSDLYLKLYKNP